jgi:hypothetical protein
MRRGVSTLSLLATAIVFSTTLLPGPAFAKGPKSPKIKSVRFTGTSREPTVTVKGSGLGSMPRGEAVPPCFSSSPTGEDFGEGVASFVDETRGWAAGIEGDCIGLIFSSYTEKKVVFTFGSAYSEYEPIQNGDSYTVRLLVPGNSRPGIIRIK